MISSCRPRKSKRKSLQSCWVGSPAIHCQYDGEKDVYGGKGLRTVLSCIDSVNFVFRQDTELTIADAELLLKLRERISCLGCASVATTRHGAGLASGRSGIHRISTRAARQFRSFQSEREVVFRMLWG
jgi:hypothetical protein